MTIPPDRGHIATEQIHSTTTELDLLSTKECVALLSKDHNQAVMAVEQAAPQISTFIDALIPKIKDGGRLIYIGCGTSGRLGVLDAAECPPTYRTDPEMVQGIIAGGYDAMVRSIEGAEDCLEDGAQVVSDHNITANDTVLGITACSSTPFVLGALKEAKKTGAITGLIICNKLSNLEYVDHLISLIVGPEVITGSTRMKAGTATKLVLNMITTTLMIKLNKTYGNLMVDLKASNKKLWDRGTRIIVHLTGLDYEDSLQLLRSANGEVKTAIVMKKKNCTYEEGVQLLQSVSGSLKTALTIIDVNL